MGLSDQQKKDILAKFYNENRTSLRYLGNQGPDNNPNANEFLYDQNTNNEATIRVRDSLINSLKDENLEELAKKFNTEVDELTEDQIIGAALYPAIEEIVEEKIEAVTNRVNRNLEEAYRLEHYDTSNSARAQAEKLKEDAERFQTRIDKLNKLLDKAAEKADVIRSISYKEQCFLLTNIGIWSAMKLTIDAETDNKTLPNGSENSSLLVQGDPFGFMNRLTQYSTKEHFFDITNAELSGLQPMIRLYKIIFNEGQNKEEQVELSFDSHYAYDNIENMFETRKSGIGLKSFNFSYEASNPYSIKKSIKAKLVLFASTFSELFTERGTEPNKYKFIDLALKTGGTKTFTLDTTNPQMADVAIENLSKLQFRLKAVVGWAIPNPDGSFETIIRGETLNAINNSYITLNLSPTVHTFDIDDMGRVTFTINYFAYVDDFFEQNEFDIFSDPAIKINQIEREAKYKELLKICKTADINELKSSEEALEEIKEEKRQNLQFLLKTLFKEDKVRFYEEDIETLKFYKGSGAFRTIDKDDIEKWYYKYVFPNATLDTYRSLDLDGIELMEFISSYADERIAEQGEVNNAINAEIDEEDNKKVDYNGIVSFVYLSDMVDVILKYIGIMLKEVSVSRNEVIKDEDREKYKRYLENFKKFRVLLGPIELVSEPLKDENEYYFVTLGDIPVSIRYLMEWLSNKMLKRDRASYPLGRFLPDLINDLISNFLNGDSCFGGRVKQRTSLFQSTITEYKTNDSDSITEKIGSNKPPRLWLDDNTFMPVLQVAGNNSNPGGDAGFENEINYMIFYAGRTQPTTSMTGDRGQDHGRGIWHYGIGRDKGIIKTIQLQKNQVKGHAETRFEQDGYDGLKQLRVLYHSNIKTFLDVNAFPGNYVYIVPESFDPGTGLDLTEFGIGGYNMIVRSEHSLGPGLAETTITAKWVAERDNNDPDQNGPEAVEAEDSASPKKCYAEKRNPSDSKYSSEFLDKYIKA